MLERLDEIGYDIFQEIRPALSWNYRGKPRSRDGRM